MLQWVPTWNRNKLGMPRSFLLPWRTIPALALRFTRFLNFCVTQPCKGEKERGASNIGNFRNKNKHNISLIIIPMPPVSITFSAASEYLNSSSSTVPHHLHSQHRNAVDTSAPLQWKPPLPKSEKITATVLWPLLIKNTVFVLAKKLTSLTGNTWEALQCVRWHQNDP